MHELSLCQNIMRVLAKQWQQHEIEKITDLWLEIGALSCVEISALEFCFNISCKGTPAENCQLHFILIPARAWCWQCQKEVEVQAYQDGCPECQSSHLQVQDSNPLRIKEIAVK